MVASNRLTRTLRLRQVETSRSACESYLTTVWGDALAADPLLHLVTWRLDGRTSATFADVRSAAGWLTATVIGSPSCVYVHAGLTRGSFLGTTRPRAEEIDAIPGLWADIDYQDAVHAAPNLPPTLQIVLDFLDAIVLKPTVVVHTGHGVLAWWLFREPWIFEDADSRALAAELSTRWQAYLRGRLGYALDPTSDLARVTRPAGVLNRKAVPVPTSVIWETDRRYSPQDFLDVGLPDVADRLRHGQAIMDGRFPPARIEPILSGCAWLRHCYNDRVRLPEPEWHAMLSIVGRTVNGSDNAHEFSRGHPDYSLLATEKKLSGALQAGPRTCDWIAQTTGGRWCAECPARLIGLKSPIVMGRLE